MARLTSTRILSIPPTPSLCTVSLPSVGMSIPATPRWHTVALPEINPLPNARAPSQFMLHPLLDSEEYKRRSKLFRRQWSIHTNIEESFEPTTLAKPISSWILPVIRLWRG